MSRKLFLGLFALMFFSVSAFAGFGVGARGGKLFGNSGFDKYSDHRYYIRGGYQDYEADFFNYGADVFFEKRINNEIFGFYGYGYIGVKAGYTKYNDSYYEMYSELYGRDEMKITSKAYGIPIMLYYKYEYADNNRAKAWGGLGAVLLYHEYEYMASGYILGNDEKKESSSAVMPQIEIGAEYELTRMINIFLSLGYQFNGNMEAKFDNAMFDETYVDFSGIYINIGVNFHLISGRRE